MPGVEVLCRILCLLSATVSVVSALYVEIGNQAVIPCDRNCSTFKSQLKDNSGRHFDVFSNVNGNITVGPGFKDRLEFSEGNTSFSIKRAVKNDEGWYVFTCDGAKTCDIYLEVVDPHVLNFTVGEKAILHCYANTKGKSIADSHGFYWWEKDGHPVETLGKGFKDRDSMSTEKFTTGDLSLTISLITPSDAGLYKCILSDEKVSKFIRVNVAAHQYVHETKVGESVSLDLLLLEADISVTKASGETKVCNVTNNSLSCSADYMHRSMISNNSLVLNSLSTNDAGTYTFTDVKSGEVIAKYRLVLCDLEPCKIPLCIGVSSGLCVIIAVLCVGITSAVWAKCCQSAEKGRLPKAEYAEPEELALPMMDTNSDGTVMWDEN